MLSFILNEELISTDKPAGYRVLDFIRNDKNLKGTKESCREGDCGACTVLLGEKINSQLFYRTTTSCLLLLGEIHGKHIVTIEGLNQDQLTPLQQCIVDEHASQCGFCTPGILVSITGYLLSCENFSYDDMILSLDGNICRCTGYSSIKRAAKKLTTLLENKTDELLHSTDRISKLTGWKILPGYFLNIRKRMEEIPPVILERNYDEVIVAGGTDLVVQKDEEIADYRLSFFNSSQPGEKIKIKGEDCYIASSATVNEIYYSKELEKILPEIKNKFHLISSTPIRNMATLGGNLVNASPIGDLSVFFLALDSEICLMQNGQERIILLKNFFLDYKKLNKTPDELIMWLRFKHFSDTTKLNFEKISKRERLDIASVNSAMRITTDKNIIKDITISAGGIAPIPKYFSTVKTIIGKEMNEQTVKETAELCSEEISPITDIRGSKKYKSLLLRQLIYAHFISLFKEKIKPEKLI